jgi:hypothetical protein
LKDNVRIAAVLTTIVILGAGLTILVASPQTGDHGAELGNVLLLAAVTFTTFIVDAALLKTFFSISRKRGLVLLAIVGAVSSVVLNVMIPSNQGLTLGRFIAGNLLFVLPGFLAGMIIFFHLTSRDATTAR